MIGPLIGAHEVTKAAAATLTTWLPSVLDEVNQAKGLELADPSSFEQVPTADAVRQIDGTTVAIAAPGLIGEPHRSGRGEWSATWAVVVTVFTRQDDYASTLAAASAYGVAVRTALLQHPTLGGIASAVDWTAEEIAPVGDPATARTLALCSLEFAVTVPEVLDDSAAPIDPPWDAEEPRPHLYGDRPVVTSTTATLTERGAETP